jgi:hypothetical protein
VEEEGLKVEKANEEEGEKAGNRPSICALMSSDNVFTTRHSSSTLFSWIISGRRKSPVEGMTQHRTREGRKESGRREEKRARNEGCKEVRKASFIYPSVMISLPSAIPLPLSYTKLDPRPYLHPHVPVAFEMLSMMLTTSELVFVLGLTLGGRERESPLELGSPSASGALNSDSNSCTSI